MKRYLVFAFSTYYPCGGMEDFICDIDDLSQLNDILKDLREDQFHVYDTVLKEFTIKDTYISDNNKTEI
jgi:hypothetical protein